MAEGVQGAEVIVCFLTAKYQASTNCQQELQIARDSKVPIVPCRVQSSWKPSAWLRSSCIFSPQCSFRNLIRYQEYFSTCSRTVSNGRHR